MVKVFIVGTDLLIERMFNGREGFSVVKEAKDADLVCYTGGADVDPSYYGDVMHRATGSNPGRDEREKDLFDSLPKELPKVGICRGSQFLNVMSGGKLWQDVDNHAINRTHEVFYLSSGAFDYKKSHNKNFSTGDNEVIQCTSTHHQMMKPDKKTSELWGYAYRSYYRDTGRDRGKEANREESPDVEIVYYKHTNSLCFQPHPEYGVKSCEDLFFTCIERAFS